MKTLEPEFCDLTAAQACARLGIARQTLYAYVSRGLLRCLADPADSRRSLYDRRDIEQLAHRQKRARSRASIARSTIDWGEPVISSSITNIDDGRLFYRGRDAIALSENATLEEVAQLLIGPAFNSGSRQLATLLPPCGGPPIGRLARTMLMLEEEDIKPSPRNILHHAVAALTGHSCGPAAPIHECLARAWSTVPQAGDLIRRALILCADHELNASAYAARVTASTGAGLPAAILSGLMALSGPRHGGQTLLARVWLDACASGEPLAGLPPGFGHRLYPDGDIRAKALLQHAALPEVYRNAINAAAAATGVQPTLDIGLAAVELKLGLPHGAGLGLFALGRLCGWMAHALEQQASGKLIRPRAIYQAQ